MDHDSLPYFESCRQKELSIAHCQRCGSWFHYPRALCPRCLSDEVRLDPVRGTGTLYTRVTRRDAAGRALQRLAWVELDEQAGLIVIGALLDDAPIGTRVALDWIAWEESFALAFRRERTGAA